MKFKLEWDSDVGAIRLIFEIDGETRIIPMEEGIVKKMLRIHD